MDSSQVVEWLMDGDPSIRWQVMHDLMGANDQAVARERKKVATEGWGAKFLSHQDAIGRWGGQLYNNKWLSTTYTLLLLRQIGLEPANRQAHLGCRELLEGGFRESGGICFGKTVDRIDNAVTGMVLSMLSYFGYPDARVHTIAEYLLGEQMPDGRWEPEIGNKQIRYTYDATLLMLEGLHEYEKQYPTRSKQVVDAERRGREFLLRHRLFKSEQSDTIIDKKMMLFSFPPRWHYDLLAALDYFQDCKAERDQRLGDAIDLVRSKQGRDGAWKLQNRHAGKTFFEMEQVGKPSRWNTLRALRVLKWWAGG
jgi:hypothetical protein